MFRKSYDQSGGYTSDKYTSSIFYDINGKNPPNTFGKDLFFFEITDKTIKAHGMEGTRYYNFPCDGDGLGATACIIIHNNMKYLHCIGIRPYDTKTKCN